MVPWTVAREAQVALVKCRQVYRDRARVEEGLLRAQRKAREAFLGRFGEGDDAAWIGLSMKEEESAERYRFESAALYRRTYPECFGED